VEKRALKVAPDVSSVGGVDAHRPGTHPSAATFRADKFLANPGLKPWAMVYNRFAVQLLYNPGLKPWAMMYNPPRRVQLLYKPGLKPWAMMYNRFAVQLLYNPGLKPSAMMYNPPRGVHLLHTQS
jgi:hypothetical protein